MTRRRRTGFTLIEMLAVITMFALIAALVMPSVDFGGSRAVRSEAQDLAAAAEFARQRAVMTGRSHQLVIEPARAAHWVEWAPRAEPEPVATQEDVRVIEFVPPPLSIERFEPVPGEFGRVRVADDDVAILGVEIDGALADTGRVELRMDPDGASQGATIVLGDLAGEHAVQVEVAPLADAVLVLDVE